MNDQFKFSWALWVGLPLTLALATTLLPLGAAPRRHTPLTNVTVVVTDAATHKPVFQARLTLEFRDPESHLGKVLSYNAKTDIQGKYKFTFIPMEQVFLAVTAPDHQSFGKQIDISQENQTISVRLNPPQPLR